MNCALWLNKRKIRHASEIPDNLDVASLRGYFLAGSLSEWLLENGGKAYAEGLAGLSHDDPELNEKLAKIFGGKADFGKALNSAPREGSQAQTPSPAPSSFAGSFAARNSFRFTKLGSGSFSYEWLTSFGGFWEFIRKLRSGSFTFLTGSFGSYHEWEWEWLFELYRHWRGGLGSFSITSFSSFPIGFGSYNIFGDIFSVFGGQAFGSFEIRRLLDTLALDEYDRIMFETLMFCPLDRFGYGIHNI